MNIEDKIIEMTKRVNSPEGQKIIREAMEKAEQMKRELDEARKIDWQTLHQPFDI